MTGNGTSQPKREARGSPGRFGAIRTSLLKLPLGEFQKAGLRVCQIRLVLWLFEQGV